MGRRCVVPSCTSTDLTMLVHRFPRKHCQAWQASLQLSSYSVKDLLEKYVVCAHHFRVSDYRHRESKHLNTTAIPTLDDIPDADKIQDCRTSALKTNKRSSVTGTTNGVSDTGSSHLNSNSLVGRMQTYSNCVTLSGVSPVAKLTSLRDPVESDTSLENKFYSDGDIIEEETDEVMMLLESDVSPTDVQEYVSVAVNYEEVEDVEDTFTEHESFHDDMPLNCDNDAEMAVSRTNFVDVIETNDETDYDYDDDDDGCELVDENTILFKEFSRKDLIDELLAARRRIKELEAKLGNIQKAHLSMIQNLNNFNKVLIS